MSESAPHASPATGSSTPETDAPEPDVLWSVLVEESTKFRGSHVTTRWNEIAQKLKDAYAIILTQLTKAARERDEANEKMGRLTGWIDSNLIFDKPEEREELLQAGWEWIDQMREFANEEAKQAETQRDEARREREELVLKWESDTPGKPGRMLRALADYVSRVTNTQGSSRPPAMELQQFVERFTAERDEATALLAATRIERDEHQNAHAIVRENRDAIRAILAEVQKERDEAIALQKHIRSNLKTRERHAVEAGKDRDAAQARAQLETALREQGGVGLIAQERLRQIEKEGWSKDHDAHHDMGELAKAAACYACPNAIREFASQRGHVQYDSVDRPDTLTWPFEQEELKLGSEIRNLVKAGALIAAEIDRLNPNQPKK